MENPNPPNPAPPENSPGRSRRAWLLIAGFALVILLVLLPRRDKSPATHSAATGSSSSSTDGADSSAQDGSLVRLARTQSIDQPARTAEEIVAGKLSQFTRSRRELARAMAKRKGARVPVEVERFFDSLESGNWPEIDSQFNALGKQSGQYEGSTHSPELDPVWNAVLDAYGAAEQVHEWPAQKLLDYGNAILDSLRPGMVYVGGTDNGRWIPELLNETSGGEEHVIVTQNAMADGRYVEYMNTLYGDRLATLTEEDSQRAFRDYVSDAQKRLEHDQQFPDEPKQLRHGEDVKIIDGKVQVSGQIAVMSINEKLLQALMTKNPDLSFAIQESFPFKGTYSDALPLGPLMELNAGGGQNSFTAERAAEFLDYWQTAARKVFADPETIGSTYALKSYSHDAVAAANLLAAHDFGVEAEQAYRLANQLWPENPESVGGLADLLVQSGRESEARGLLEEFTRQHPKQREDLERISAAMRIIGPAQPAKP